MIRTLRSEVLSQLLKGCGQISKIGYRQSEPVTIRTKLRKTDEGYKSETIMETVWSK